jgi:hypothetical protein
MLKSLLWMIGPALVFGGPATTAAAEPSAPAAAYVVLGGQGAMARAIVPSGAQAVVPVCPEITVDDRSQTMTVRARPDTAFPILVCEFLLPSGARSAAIGGQALPLPKATLTSIAAFGDTGCRLKAGKSSAEDAARESNEPDETGKFQDCNNQADWPFAPMSATIAGVTPDVVVHVGDYLYRESPCPSGDTGCQGSPSGDNWATWQADFFAPAAPLLQAAPWIATRGNHETCKRNGTGYALLLDPAPGGGTLPPACTKLIDEYQVDVADRRFIILDSSDAADECPQAGCDSKPYAEQFARMRAKPGTWLVTHRPIWGFTTAKSDSGGRSLVIRNMTLQAALENGKLPNNVDLVLSGHIHLWEALSFADGRPPQFVLGSGSTELAHNIKESLIGQPIGGTTVASAATDHHFGYTLFTPSNSGRHWTATYFDTGGKKKFACKVESAEVTCN